jgi:WhiB family transcriptional regulator, redox-sensing transcriptional regulator
MTAGKAAAAAPDRGEWRARAACGRADPDLFFPDRSADITAAVAICAGCPVRAECHEFAEATNQVHGVWAGVNRSDPKERRKARRAASAA